jgi:KDO2-lipid IV(A) lauroyltransferase
VIESLKAHKLIQAQNWREHVVLEIPPATEALLQAPGQGVLLVSGHLGNWEVAAQILSHLKPVVGITRPLNNPLSEALIRRRKERGRFRLTPKHDARLDRLLATLRDGEILALLVDQHAGSQGIAIDFFGHPACTHASPALLHLVTRAPICFGYCVRTRPMHFIFRAAEPIVRPPSGNRQEDVRAVLRHLNRELEAAIREYPSQYVWAHRRWRS